jgi:cyclohexadienyl dehydratase
LWSEPIGRRRPVLTALLVAAWGLGCGTGLEGAAASETAPPLLEAVAQRLSLMREVAAHKWVHGLAVEDPAREAVVIEAARADGLRRLLRPETVEPFFRLQIEAAKDIQRHWFDRWEDEGGPDEAPDLTAEIRPQLLTLGRDIVDALGAGDPVVEDRQRFHEHLNAEGLSAARVDELFDALLAVRRFEGHLDQIRSIGVLRVGTTGDYPPFSHSERGESFEGIDIELARDLAASLEVRLALVRTSWPTLLTDLEAGRWDIAMSGISRTEARARAGRLSRAYYTGGKTPIARCERKDRFASLDQIDTPGVRVIVNPGGTNEEFVDAHITRAEKVLHPDNRTIFHALIAGAADVMITDRIEVALQTRRHAELCATMPHTLTYQEKGYLLPRDDAWKQYVDSWLVARMQNGMVARLIEEHLQR